VLYKIGGKLIGERTRRLSSFIISECLLDVALICASRSDMLEVFEEVTGLTLSIPKTKLLVAGANLTANDIAPFELGGGSVKVVKEFKYLGSLMEACGGVSGEVNRRIIPTTLHQIHYMISKLRHKASIPLPRIGTVLTMC